MRALICGVDGQDGSYLSRLLLGKEYELIGASRDAMASSFSNLKNIGILDAVFTTSMTITDFRSVLQTLVKHQLDEIYNLAGQSSVGLSFEQPVETMESIAIGTLNLLDAIRFYGKPIRLYNVKFSEYFGETGAIPASEETPFRSAVPMQ